MPQWAIPVIAIGALVVFGLTLGYFNTPESDRSWFRSETIGERLTRECESIVEAAGYRGNTTLIRRCVLDRGMREK